MPSGGNKFSVYTIIVSIVSVNCVFMLPLVATGVWIPELKCKDSGLMDA